MLLKKTVHFKFKKNFIKVFSGYLKSMNLEFIQTLLFRFQNIAIAINILADPLLFLEKTGIISKEEHSESKAKFIYKITPKASTKTQLDHLQYYSGFAGTPIKVAFFESVSPFINTDKFSSIVPSSIFES